MKDIVLSRDDACIYIYIYISSSGYWKLPIVSSRDNQLRRLVDLDIVDVGLDVVESQWINLIDSDDDTIQNGSKSRIMQLK